MSNINKFNKVGVLYGGISLEREISLRSGKQVYQTLIDNKIEAVLLDWNVKEQLIPLLQGAEVDVVFIALHGQFGEDGYVQTILNKLKIPYTGSGAVASKLLMNKLKTKQHFIDNGFATPKCIELNDGFDEQSLLDKISLPLVIKPISEGSSIGITIVKQQEKLQTAYQLAKQSGSGVIAEQYIEGAEITVTILDNMVLPTINVQPQQEFYDFAAKYEPGTTYICPGITNQSLENKVKQYCLAAFQSTGARGWGRVDGILDSANQFHLIEINTIPGLTATSLVPKSAKAYGLSFIELVEHILAVAKFDT